MPASVHLTELSYLVAADAELGGLNFSHIRLLSVICAAKVPPSIGAVATDLKVTQPTMSRLADRLERDGYLQRIASPTHRRTTLLTPTDKGVELDARIRGHVASARRHARQVAA